jgi:hypothetical protein
LVEDMGIYGATGSGDGDMEPWAVDTFPRRGTMVGIRPLQEVRDRKRVPLAEFRIPNPDQRSHPAWATPMPPFTQVRDGLSFTLTDFRTRLRSMEKKGPLPPDEMPWTRATFRVTRNGRPVTTWYPNEMELTEATGNHWQPRMTGHATGGTEPDFWIQGPFSPAETYRLTVEFTNEREYGPEDRWTLPPLPVPAPKARSPLSLTRTFGRATVSVTEILGAGASVERLPVRSGTPHLHVVVTPKELWSRRVVLLRAVDQRGRDVLVMDQPEVTDTDGHSWFAFKPLKGIKTLHLTLAVRRSYFLDFQACPVDASPG